jgi:hypothetical protein
MGIGWRWPVMVDTVVPGVSRGRGKSEQLECEGEGENGVKDLPTSAHVRDKPAFPCEATATGSACSPRGGTVIE